MDSIETLIPDNEGNHLVVVLSFYEEYQKIDTFQIPTEFAELDIVDIAINKLDLNRPLHMRAFSKMCEWLMSQFISLPNAVFTYICSIDDLETNHKDIAPEQYRWRLFEYFYSRKRAQLIDMGIASQDIIVGPENYQTFAKVFYRTSHAPIIHFVIDHLNSKYS